MATVYAISSGSYSDYGINYVFRTRDLAEAFLAREEGISGWHEYVIEEWELLDELPVRTARYNSYADLEADGTLTNISIEGHTLDETSATADKERESVTASGPWAPTRRGVIRLGVAGRRSREEAEKALQDLAARVKAERAGIV